MIAAFDVHYPAWGPARAAAVLFESYGAGVPARVLSLAFPVPAAYVPGSLYKRELPGILALLDRFDRLPSEAVIDGYVRLGARAGLGWHLYRALERRVPVIGVAKSRFEGAEAVTVFRGGSRRPLHITAAGIPVGDAARRISGMHGDHRIPTLLGKVDRIARGIDSE